MSLLNRTQFRLAEQRRSLQDLNDLLAAYAEALPLLEEEGLVESTGEKEQTPEQVRGRLSGISVRGSVGRAAPGEEEATEEDLHAFSTPADV